MIGLTWNPSRVSELLSSTLIPPTPPRPQVLKSKNQIVVFESVTVTGRFVIAVSLPASLKLESKPLIVIFVLCAGTQGLANVDWVTV